MGRCAPPALQRRQELPTDDPGHTGSLPVAARWMKQIVTRADEARTSRQTSLNSPGNRPRIERLHGGVPEIPRIPGYDRQSVAKCCRRNQRIDQRQRAPGLQLIGHQDSPCRRDLAIYRETSSFKPGLKVQAKPTRQFVATPARRQKFNPLLYLSQRDHTHVLRCPRRGLNASPAPRIGPCHPAVLRQHIGVDQVSGHPKWIAPGSSRDRSRSSSDPANGEFSNNSDKLRNRPSTGAHAVSGKVRSLVRTS